MPLVLVLFRCAIVGTIEQASNACVEHFLLITPLLFHPHAFTSILRVEQTLDFDIRERAIHVPQESHSAAKRTNTMQSWVRPHGAAQRLPKMQRAVRHRIHSLRGPKAAAQYPLPGHPNVHAPQQRQARLALLDRPASEGDLTIPAHQCVDPRTNVVTLAGPVNPKAREC